MVRHRGPFVVALVWLFLLASACGGDIELSDDDDPQMPGDGGDGDTATTGGDGDTTGGDGDTTGGDGDTTTGGDGDGEGDTTTGGDGDGDTTTGGDGDGDGDGDEPDGPSPILPTATAPCPSFESGTVRFTVDGRERQARVWIDPAKASATSGPIVFYWYGTGGSPAQAISSLESGIDQIVDAGGMVVAPTHVNGGQFPWISDPQTDFRLADEVVACAVETLGNDGRRVHSLGFSAGGLYTTAFGYARSNYLASVAAYSGGGRGTLQNPDNPLAALIFHGGPGDNVFGQDFERSSTEWRDDLVVKGGFTLLCDHGRGHRTPLAGGPAVTAFFFDHPYGVESAYRESLPGSVPDYCVAR